MRSLILALLLSILLAGLRIAGHTSEAFQAAAHMFVGASIAAWWVGRRNRNTLWDSESGFRAAIIPPYEPVDHSARLYLYLAIALSVVEVACFVWSALTTGTT